MTLFLLWNNDILLNALDYMKNTGIWDYKQMNSEHKAKLVVIMNSSEALSVMIGEKIKWAIKTKLKEILFIN